MPRVDYVAAFVVIVAATRRRAPSTRAFPEFVHGVKDRQARPS
jgi:hypothetical protein